MYLISDSIWDYISKNLPQDVKMMIISHVKYIKDEDNCIADCLDPDYAENYR